MWQEAQSGEVDLKLPSISEMKAAFQQIGAQQTNGAFAFFIDGLDEFTGNHREGISFVKSLITSANIKILLSSRPIDTCVAAFLLAPRLKLQDLTKSDIAAYINDVVRSHPYVCEDKCRSIYWSCPILASLVDLYMRLYPRTHSAAGNNVSNVPVH